MRKLTTKLLSFQLTIVILGGLLFISIYSIVNTYNKHIESSKNGEFDKLKAITKTLSVVIDGDEHQELITKYLSKDEVKTSDQDSIYEKIHKIMRKVQLDNGIQTDMYLLFFNDDKSKLSFSVTSGENPYYRHEYTSYPKELTDFYDDGATIEPYEDEHGTWLSAFAPLKTSDGKTTCIIQADIQFDSFIDEARDEMMYNITTSTIIFIIITVFVLYTVRKLSKIDQEKTDKLNEAFSELKVKNRDIQDSINYALRIQKALIPESSEVCEHLPESFMFYEPKDVVSGDFPWFYKKDNYIYFAAVDCTGHGVPGAMMSIIGCLLLNDLANNEKAVEPGEMLNQLHKSVVETLKQEENARGVADGMDLALCRIDLTSNEVHYAGAHRPLYHLNMSGELTQYKGCPYPIGGSQYKGKNHYKNQIIKVNKGDSIYFFSDGLPDQFGGENQRKFGPKRIRDLILEIENFAEMRNTFHKAYLDWKGEGKQIDDILLIGVKF